MIRCPSHESNHHTVRIDKSIARAKAAAHDVITAKLGKHVADLVARNQPNILQSHCDLLLIVRAQISEMFFVSGTEQVTLRPVVSGISELVVEAGIKRNGIKRHLNVNRRGELSSHPTHTLAGGTLALSRLPLDHQNVPTSRGGQMISDA